MRIWLSPSIITSGLNLKSGLQKRYKNLAQKIGPCLNPCNPIVNSHLEKIQPLLTLTGGLSSTMKQKCTPQMSYQEILINLESAKLLKLSIVSSKSLRGRLKERLTRELSKNLLKMVSAGLNKLLLRISLTRESIQIFLILISVLISLSVLYFD